MIRIMKYMMVAVVLIFGMASMANAQCAPSHPFALVLGESYCVEVCGPFGIYSFFLEGDPTTGPDEIPILTFDAGCNPLNSNCNLDCNPLDPPVSEWILGGDPQGFYPDWYWTGTACFEVMIRWAHDGTWDIIIISYCDGCFCMTFDSQLPVELMSFGAVEGDSEVLLNWTTGSEVNNDRFDILRDGEKVTEIRSTNHTSGDSYSWLDENVVNGRTYGYDLIAVDNAGHSELLGHVQANPGVNSGIVTEYALHQNYPNPFNPETQIAFDLVESQFVTLSVFNLLGQEVTTLANGKLNAGRHVVDFDGSNLTAGVYIYSITAGEFSAAKKLVLLK